MVKKSIFQILNGFRVVAFWIFMALLVVSIMAAVREARVEITLEDGVLGDRINHYGLDGNIQEFDCNVNGKNIVVVDTEGRKTGDKVQLIFRDGSYYALVNPDFPDSGVTFMDRVSFRFNMATGGNLLFTVIAYVFFLLLTLKTRKETIEEFPILLIITHIAGLLSVILFILMCYWLDFVNLIIYAVIFAIIWMGWVIVHNVRKK